MVGTRTRAGGFTLIEVLVGLAVMVLLVGMIQGIYAAAARSREAADSKTAVVHSAAMTVSRMCDELASGFVVKTRGDETYFSAREDATGRSVLLFTTLMPPVHGLRAGGETRVRYVTEPDKESEIRGALKLMRTELADPKKEMDRDGVTYEMLKGITGFTIECFNGEEWVDRWEDTDTRDPKLPKAVRIEITWGEEGGAESFSASTILYRGQ